MLFTEVIVRKRKNGRADVRRTTDGHTDGLTDDQCETIIPVIKFLTKEGAKTKEIHWRMADVYGDSSPKYPTVAKWSAEFKRGRDSLEDDPRPGRSADVISQEMIDRVERLVLNNRRIKVAELASECGISNGSVYTIIHKHLGMSQVSARWVPRNLNMQDRQQVKNFWKCTMPIQKTFTLVL